MQKALIFILALALIIFIVFSKPKEGFTDLMGVNWSDMNKGTPKALYTDLPIKQPKVVNLAEAGVGNIQPSPPAPGTLPSAPAPQRSLETPNPYIDPTNEPAKYIRILGVKEDLQAFFGFQAFMLQERNDPSIQIPLCRARADMAELINVQSVMERNPGLPSRINNKQLNDIQANLNYLRDILHELESSGAIQPQAPIEGFVNITDSGKYDKTNPLKVYMKEYFIPIFRQFISRMSEFGIPSEIIKNYNEDYLISFNNLEAMIDNNDPSLSIIDDNVITNIRENGKMLINMLLDNYKVPSSIFAPVILFEKNFTVEDVRRLIESDPRTRGGQSGPSLGSTATEMKPTPSMGSIPPTASSTGNLSTQYTTITTDRRATLKQLQDFQIRVVVEIKRLQASGTSDPVINGRLNTLMRIQDDVDQVISQIQNGSLTPETVPIYASDIERALPLLGKPSDPLPTILKENNLPPAISNLFPGGLSPKDTEQAQQINNIVAGYMDNIFEGTSWGLSLDLKYDNPNAAKLATRKAEAEAVASIFGQTKEAVQEVKGQDKALSYLIRSTTTPNTQGTGVPGLPGLSEKEKFVGFDPMMEMQGASSPNFGFTNTQFELGLPGTSINRTLPEPRIGRLDWKQRSQQIKEQIRRRGYDPKHFGALPDDANVSSDFSWRGYAQMMCMRLNTTLDPGLAETCGCPPQGWQGWRD